MVDNKTTDNKSAAKGSASSEAKKTSAASTKSASPVTKTTATAKTSAPSNSSATTNSSATKGTSPAKRTSPKAASAATAKAGALNDSAMKAAAKKLSAEDKVSADNAIKSKKSVKDLKSRAHEAKQRAQKKILEEAYVSDKPTDPLERLANTFDSSAKRWEMVVYPSLFAFVLLAGYGFFLIYRLTHDIAVLSQSVTHMAVIVSDAMPRMSHDLTRMTNSVDNMTSDIGGMTTEISSMSGQMNSLTPMSKNIQSMTHNIGSMNRSVYGMQRDMHGMNRTVSSGPFGMMNDVMPFSSNTNVPPPIAPQPVWPSYNPVPAPRHAYSQPPARPQLKTRATSKAKPVSDKKKIEQKNLARNKLQNNLKQKVIMPGASPVSLKESSINSQ